MGKKQLKNWDGTDDTMWCPPVISWFITPINSFVISTINHSEIGVMFTNLAIELGHHLASTLVHTNDLDGENHPQPVFVRGEFPLHFRRKPGQ